MATTSLILTALLLTTVLVPSAMAVGPDPDEPVVCIELRNTMAPPDTCVNGDGSVCQETASGEWDCIDPTP